MCKLKIELDSYKEFFTSEHGLKLIEEIIENRDYDAIKALAKWEQCASKVLDKIAVKFMVVDANERVTGNNLRMLEELAENPKISVKTLGELCDFASDLLGDYGSSASEVLEEIAESKKLNDEIARKLYKVALEYSLHDIMEELAENPKTPDEVLFDIIEFYDEENEQYSKACKQIIKRYKKVKEQQAKDETE